MAQYPTHDAASCVVESEKPMGTRVRPDAVNRRRRFHVKHPEVQDAACESVTGQCGRSVQPCFLSVNGRVCFT